MSRRGEGSVARILLATIALAAALPAAGQQGGDAQGFVKAISPGEHHAHFKKMVGKWNAAVRSWPVPGGEPTEVSGATEYELVLGGRYLQQKMTAQMMGMPYEGLGLSGYDNTAGKHTLLWVDSMSTWMTYGEGDCSDDHKTQTIRAEVKNPMGGPTMRAKLVTRIESDDKHVFEYYIVGDDGSETKVLEVVYTRA
ncbi:MAG TPA: DUF1579 domain-containing protein [Candidatus Polarisedimenticolaceae bacterium]|nr:DUF1579 domain-containing protein [Candidatus Polarisedimenticolaceae bacterium]